MINQIVFWFFDILLIFTIPSIFQTKWFMEKLKFNKFKYAICTFLNLFFIFFNTGLIILFFYIKSLL